MNYYITKIRRPAASRERYIRLSEVSTAFVYFADCTPEIVCLHGFTGAGEADEADAYKKKTAPLYCRGRGGGEAYSALKSAKSAKFAPLLLKWNKRVCGLGNVLIYS